MMARNRTGMQDLAGLLREAGIEGAEALAAIAVPSWRISVTRTSLAELELGQSRFGGCPDVPLDFQWPMFGGEPLTFLAQFDLSQVSDPSLPRNGWLLIFYDVAGQPWGLDAQDAGTASVAYVSAPKQSLVRREHPVVRDKFAGPFESCSITMTATMDLPQVWDRIVAHAGVEVSQEHWGAYWAVSTVVSGVEEGTPYHHLLGHPQLVQNDMRGDCELVTNGIACAGPQSYESERARQLLDRAPAEWVLLLQLATDDTVGWTWGGDGRLYVWMRRSDLAARAFEKAWLILQCS